MCGLSFEEEEELSAYDDDERRHNIWNRIQQSLEDADFPSRRRWFALRMSCRICKWLHTADLPWTFRNSCVGRGTAFVIAVPVRKHLATPTEKSTHAILQKLSFGNGSMRKERNSSRERSKTLVWCSEVIRHVREI